MKCSAFWKHTNIRPGNRIYPCCRFKSPVGMFDGDLENVLYSDTYKMLRNRAAADEFIPGCDKCAYEESIGHKSLRQEFNEKYDRETVGLEYLEIGMDNLCNLVCDGCNSEFSTSWIAKEETLYGKAYNKHLTVDEIKTVPASVKKILFLGGEPLITDKHLQLLKLHPTPEECTVTYNTNASYLPTDELMYEWSAFKEVNFIISIDGIGNVNETVRGGSKWIDTLNFIDFCIGNELDFEFNTVLHKNNIFDLHNLIEFMERFDNKWYINLLTYPETLKITQHDKHTIQEYLQTISHLDYPNKDYIANFVSNSV